MDIKSYNKLPEKIKITLNNLKKELISVLLQNGFNTVEGYIQAAFVVALCIGNRINKCNYPYAHNFIYWFSHVVAFGCGMFVFDLCILFVSWRGMYIVVTC
jgi:hypothetical protein